MKALAVLLYFVKKLKKKNIIASRRLNVGHSDSLGKYVLHRILSSLQIKQIVNTAERYLRSQHRKAGLKGIKGLGSEQDQASARVKARGAGWSQDHGRRSP